MDGLLAAPQARFRRAAPLLVLLSMLLLVLMPSLNIGFTSDDYGNLVEATRRLPLTESTDGLHRPLRNVILKLSYLTFGLHSIPYHVGLIILHLAAVALLYGFILILGGNVWAAFVAAACFGCFPRNHQILFWISAGQDSVITICVLVACAAFVRFKKSRRERYLLMRCAHLERHGFELLNYTFCFHWTMRMLFFVWQWQYETLGRAKRSWMPKLFVYLAGLLDRAFPIGKPWDIVVLARRR